VHAKEDVEGDGERLVISSDAISAAIKEFTKGLGRDDDEEEEEDKNSDS
jgi:hypothetical protein